MHTRWRVLLGLSLLTGLSACASTETILRTDADPLRGYNRAMFTFNDKVDQFVLKPVARGYKAITPDPVDTSVTNFFSNIGDVIVLFNDVLQGKLGQAANDSSRIVFNTTFGVLGLFDVAGTYMELPKNNEDFGQTLGYWGVGEGYYLVLPFLGPSTTRDVWGLLVDNYVDPLERLSTSPERLGTRALYVVDLRADLLRVERAFGDAQIDPYSFQRSAYLQRRRNLVYDGNPPQAPVDFEDNNPAEPAPESGDADGDDRPL
jgi:phospholipid-binding lipoprotein MlaA